MKRGVVVVLAMALMVVGVIGAARSGPVGRAQEASPEVIPSSFEIAPGVSAEALAFMQGQDAPSLYRLRFAPGVTYEIVGDPAISLAYVEAGTLTFQLDVPVNIIRGDLPDSAGEQIAADTEFAVTAGDSFVLPPMAGGELRNEGPDEASMQIASIVPTGPMASPEASPES